MATYHEVSPSRRYEWRTFEDGRFTTWKDAGPASDETLTAIKAGMSAEDHFEVRQTCGLADETGSYVGALALTNLEFRSALKSLGVRQRWLALRLGVATSTVNRWATGELPVAPYVPFVLDLLRERREIASRLSE